MLMSTPAAPTANTVRPRPARRRQPRRAQLSALQCAGDHGPGDQGDTACLRHQQYRDSLQRVLVERQLDRDNHHLQQRAGHRRFGWHIQCADCGRLLDKRRRHQSRRGQQHRRPGDDHHGRNRVAFSSRESEQSGQSTTAGRRVRQQRGGRRHQRSSRRSCPGPAGPAP